MCFNYIFLFVSSVEQRLELNRAEAKSGLFGVAHGASGQRCYRPTPGFKLGQSVYVPSRGVTMALG